MPEAVRPMREALFLLESQPPHIGELVEVLVKLKDYDRMHICVSGVSKVMPINMSIATWHVLMAAHKDRVTICALTKEFDELTELPEIFKDCTVLTTSKALFVRLSSLNIPVELVPRTLGYHGVFVRTAYRQGRALDWLKAQATVRSLKHTPRKINVEIKKEE